MDTVPKQAAELTEGDVIVRTWTRAVKAAWTNGAGTVRTVVYENDTTEEFALAGDPSVDVQAPGA